MQDPSKDDGFRIGYHYKKPYTVELEQSTLSYQKLEGYKIGLT
jgi:hypothetical protein